MKSLLDSIWAPEEDNNEIVIQGIMYYCISIDCGGGGNPGNVDYFTTSICR